ncbi:hypothetical protein A9Q84_21740 [Halobacteriovorax marinus]|uniref:histidine kinase n=1 Tax=Halobacteriovorax marinus TaxID=97084 RepID=A0A1Y5F1X5_9BACT|nr:hypothetical protein A9Q84_21740 [Halobacteriovorax marinus]
MKERDISKDFDYYYEKKNKALFESFHYITTMILVFFTLVNVFSNNYIEAKVDGLMLVYQWLIFILYKKKLNYNLSIILYLTGIGFLVNAVHYISPQNLDSNVIWSPILIILGHFLGGRKVGLFVFISTIIVVISFDYLKSISPGLTSYYFPEKVFVFNMLIISASCLLSFIVGRKINLSELNLVQIIKDKELKNLALNKDTISLLSILTHDFTAPISICQMYLSKYMRANSSTEYSKDLKKIEDNINRMIVILDNVKEISLAKFGIINLKYSEVDLRDCIIKELNFQKKEIFDKSLIVNLEWNKKEEFFILAEEVSLTNAILRTLISNAVRFNKTMGTLEILLKNEKNHVELEIRNTGHQIPEEFFNHIYEIGHSTVLKGEFKEKGMGLGLPLCKEFLNHMGSKIKIINEPNKVAVIVKFLRFAENNNKHVA